LANVTLCIRSELLGNHRRQTLISQPFPLSSSPRSYEADPENWTDRFRLVSITREMGDDPMHVMMRQMMALFDEYQSKDNAKHVLRALKENARQDLSNESLPPIGYRVVAAEQRGAKVKKKLEIDPLHADMVRLIYRLALEGDGTSGPTDVKNITGYLNRRRIFDGERWVSDRFTAS
jgi:DNA invertase Pin-like site-specific DNA recombinase